MSYTVRKVLQYDFCMCVNEDGDARMVFSIEQSVDRYCIVPCRKNCTHLWGKKKIQPKGLVSESFLNCFYII